MKSMGSGALGYLPFNPLASIYGDDETSKILTDDEENELKRILGYDEERKIEDEVFRDCFVVVCLTSAQEAFTVMIKSRAGTRRAAAETKVPAR